MPWRAFLQGSRGRIKGHSSTRLRTGLRDRGSGLVELLAQSRRQGGGRGGAATRRAPRQPLTGTKEHADSAVADREARVPGGDVVQRAAPDAASGAALRAPRAAIRAVPDRRGQTRRSSSTNPSTSDRQGHGGDAGGRALPHTRRRSWSASCWVPRRRRRPSGSEGRRTTGDAAGDEALASRAAAPRVHARLVRLLGFARQARAARLQLQPRYSAGMRSKCSPKAPSTAPAWRRKRLIGAGGKRREVAIYIARAEKKTDERGARIWVEGAGSAALSSDGSGASSVALAASEGGLVAVMLDLRSAMSPVHARTIEVGETRSRAARPRRGRVRRPFAGRAHRSRRRAEQRGPPRLHPLCAGHVVLWARVARDWRRAASRRHGAVAHVSERPRARARRRRDALRPHVGRLRAPFGGGPRFAPRARAGAHRKRRVRARAHGGPGFRLHVRLAGAAR